MTAPEPATGSPGDRLASVRRLEATALGSRALQRLTGLAVRLLDADAASVSLLGDVETVVSGDGLPTGSLGRRVPLADSLCAVTLAGGTQPLVVPDTARDRRRRVVLPGREQPRRGLRRRPARGLRRLGRRCARRLHEAAAGLGAERRQPAAPARRRRGHGAGAVRARPGSSRRTGCGSSWRSTPPRSAASTGTSPPGGWCGTTGWCSSSGTTGAPSTRRSRPSRRGSTRTTASARMGAIQDAIDSCGDFDTEFRVVLPTGETRWLHGRGRVVPDDDGTAVRFLGAGFDTTSQRHTRRPGGPRPGGHEVRLLLPRPGLAVHLRQRRVRAAAPAHPGGDARRLHLGAVPGRRGERRSRSSTAAPWPPARSGSSRPTTRHPSTPGSRCGPGRARTGCRCTSSTSPSGATPRTAPDAVRSACGSSPRSPRRSPRWSGRRAARWRPCGGWRARWCRRSATG